MMTKFKLRFFVIISAIIVVLALVYLYSTGAFKGWQIQTSFYNSSIVGVGGSTLVIPFTILQGAGQPITVPIQVQAITSIGSVKTACSAPSVCNVTFTAPSYGNTTVPEYAKVSINAGGTNTGVTKIVTIAVEPDLPSSIYIQTQYFPLCPDKTSTQVYIWATDKNRNIVPDGTLIHLNATGGTLSNYTCLTISGSCTEEYHLTAAGIAIINASAFNANTTLNITC